MTTERRTAEQRKADTLAKLTGSAADCWVASAPTTGPGYLVPLSLHWTGERLVIAVESTSITARNILDTRSARVGLGQTRDVVMIDAVLEAEHPAADAPADIADGYASQSDWDPRRAPEGYVYLVLRPTRIQAWREVGELVGRTLMREGSWLV